MGVEYPPGGLSLPGTTKSRWFATRTAARMMSAAPINHARPILRDGSRCWGAPATGCFAARHTQRMMRKSAIREKRQFSTMNLLF